MPGSVHRPNTQLHEKTSPKIFKGSHVLHCTFFTGNECSWDLNRSNIASGVCDVKFAGNRRHLLNLLIFGTLSPVLLLLRIHQTPHTCHETFWLLGTVNTLRKHQLFNQNLFADQQIKSYQLCLCLLFFCDRKVYTVSHGAKPSAVSLLTKLECWAIGSERAISIIQAPMVIGLKKLCDNDSTAQ